MNILATPLNNLPVHLLLLENGSVAFSYSFPFKPVWDLPEKGITAYFDNVGLKIDNVEYMYNTTYLYKTIPAMLSWLLQQNLYLE